MARFGLFGKGGDEENPGASEHSEGSEPAGDAEAHGGSWLPETEERSQAPAQSGSWLPEGDEGWEGGSEEPAPLHAGPLPESAAHDETVAHEDSTVAHEDSTVAHEDSTVAHTANGEAGDEAEASDVVGKS